MASWTWKLYALCISVVILVVLSTYTGVSAAATERCERREPQSFQGFQTAPPSVIRKLLADYFKSRRMKSRPRLSAKPQQVCIVQGDSCHPSSSTPCCGRMACYTYGGEECELGDSCICRNSQYHRDPYF